MKVRNYAKFLSLILTAALIFSVLSISNVFAETTGEGKILAELDVTQPTGDGAWRAYAATGGYGAYAKVNNGVLTYTIPYSDLTVGHFTQVASGNLKYPAWAGMGLRLTDEEGKGIQTDISSYANACAVYTVMFTEDTDISKMYFGAISQTISYSDDNGTFKEEKGDEYKNWTAVPVTDYYTDSDKGTYKTVVVPMSAFDEVSNENTEGGYSKWSNYSPNNVVTTEEALANGKFAYNKYQIGYKYDASRFEGLGIIRMDPEVAATHTGSVNLKAMRVVEAPAPSELAYADGSLTFTAAAASNASYEILKNDAAGNETLTDIGTAVQYTVGTQRASYKVRAKYTVDGIEFCSTWSNEVSVGTASTDMLVKDYDVRTQINNYKMYMSASALSSRTDNGTYVTLCAPFYSRDAEENKWPFAVLGVVENSATTSADLSSYEKTGAFVFKVNFGTTVDISKYAFSVCSLTEDEIGNKNKLHIFSNIPVTEYYTNADRGTVKTVVIPVERFIEKAANGGSEIGRLENVKQTYQLSSTDLDMSKFIGAGIACYEATSAAKGSGTIDVYTIARIKAETVAPTYADGKISFAEPSSYANVIGYQLEATDKVLNKTVTDIKVAVDTNGSLYYAPSDGAAKYRVRVKYNYDGASVYSPWSDEVIAGVPSKSLALAHDIKFYEGKTGLSNDWVTGMAWSSTSPSSNCSTDSSIIEKGIMYNAEFPARSDNYSASAPYRGIAGVLFDAANYTSELASDKSYCALYGIKFEKGIELNNYYFAVLNWSNSDGSLRTWTLLPVKDYLNETGVLANVSIPLDDFKKGIAYPVYHNGSEDPSTQSVIASFDMSKFFGLGIVVDSDYASDASGKYIHITNYDIIENADPVSNVIENGSKVIFEAPAAYSEVVRYEVKSGNTVTAVTGATANGNEITYEADGTVDGVRAVYVFNGVEINSAWAVPRVETYVTDENGNVLSDIQAGTLNVQSDFDISVESGMWVAALYRENSLETVAVKDLSRDSTTASFTVQAGDVIKVFVLEDLDSIKPIRDVFVLD